MRGYAPACWRGALAVVAIVVAMLPPHITAQLSTTTVQGTVYRADGTPAAGTLLVSWSAFTTPQNQAVAAGNLSASIGADGFVSVNLTPNSAALPAGSYYTATYHLNDGTVNQEYWVVPASGNASIGSVRSLLQPSTVAVQPVSKSYVDSAISSLSSSWLPLGGGTMAGPLVLQADPTAPSQAATKHYADQIGAQNLPLTGGNVSGPLNARQMEGALYADQWQSAPGNNGIAMSLAECQTYQYACSVIAPTQYAATEAQPWGGSFAWVYGQTQGPAANAPTGCVYDYRWGAPQTICTPGSFMGGVAGNRFQASPAYVMNATSNSMQLFTASSFGLTIEKNQWAGSWNFSGSQTNNTTLYLTNTDISPASSYGVLNVFTGVGNGDHIAIDSTDFSYGGINAGDNEGNEDRFSHLEAFDVWQGKLNSVSTTPVSAQVCTATPCWIFSTAKTQGGNTTLGDDRELIDLTKADTSGYIAGINSGGVVTTAGADWDGAYGDSNAWATTTQAVSWSSGAVNNPFPLTNVTIPYTNLTGAFTTSTPACLFDSDGELYECEPVTAVGTNSITLAVLRHPFNSGSTVAQGGMTGMGFSMQADWIGPGAPYGGGGNGLAGLASQDGTPNSVIRPVYPIMYNSSGGVAHVITGSRSAFGYVFTRAYSQMGSGGVVTATVSGGIVTACNATGGSGYSWGTDGLGHLLDPPQLTYSVNSGATPPVLVLTGTGSGGSLSGCTVQNGGANLTSISVSVTPSNPYAVYPMTLAFNVWNPATGAVDGSSVATDSPMPNTSAYFQPGDTLEEPHYFATSYTGQMVKVNDFMPATSGVNGRVLTFGGGGFGSAGYGDILENLNAPTLYRSYPAGSTPWVVGQGQMLTPSGYHLSGPWNNGLRLDTPTFGGQSLTGALVIDCEGPNGKVCGSWNAWSQVITHVNANNNGYAEDTLEYNPTTFTWQQTAGATGTGGANATCTTTLSGASGGGFSVSCGGHTAKFDSSGNLSLAGAVKAQAGVTGATINGEVTVDGTTYTTLNAAWNAAVAQANATGQDQTVRLGPGSFSVTTTMTEPANGTCVSVLGSSGTTMNADSPQIATTITIPSALGGDLFYLGNTSQAQGCTFKDLNIMAGGNATHGFEMQWFRGLLIDNVTVNDTTAEGILLGEESTTAGHQASFLLRNVIVSYSSAAFTPANRPAWGIHLQKTAMDSHLDDIVVRNALTAGVYNEGTGNTGYLIHGFGYPYTCTTAPCANNVSSGSAANASYATSYVIYDTGGAGSVWTDTYADSPAIAGFYVGANGIAIHGGHIQWPDLTSFPSANLAYVATTVSNNLLIADVDCLELAPGVNWITYSATSGNPPTYASIHHLTGCGNYYQALEPANVTGFSSGGANINDPSGAVPRVWSTPVAAASSYPAYSAQLYTGYQGDVFQAHFSGVNPFFNITYQGTIRTSGGIALSTVINTASTLTLTAANKNIIANAASGAQTITLPSCYTALPDKAAPTGLEFTIIKSDTSANAVTLQTVSSQNINYNGAVAQTLAISSAGKRTLVCGPDYNWYAY